METLFFSENEIEKAAKIIKQGGLVAMPTETVYGLAADAMNAQAVKSIFKAKGRPSDNPLIVHIYDISQVDSLVKSFPQKAKKLCEKFWPGPLTIILPKSDLVPNEISPGLDTVAIRMPAHPSALALIKAAGTPVAAPSANLSGSPSPVTAQHVKNDLDGKIDGILDGGRCSVGLESTVITLVKEPPVLLRPGAVTVEEIEAVIGKIHLSHAVFEKLELGKKAASPGMKYKHYSPKARVIIMKGSDEQYVSFVNSHADSNVCALCFDEDIPLLHTKAFSMGKKLDYEAQARSLFDLLRKIDDENFSTVYARCPTAAGVGMAVYNRLIRAAGFEVKTFA